jgi:hypothetical protein
MNDKSASPTNRSSIGDQSTQREHWTKVRSCGDRNLFRVGWLLLGLLGFWGCHHIGPRTIRDDRLPYNEAIASSWKQQTLLNLVRLRYADLPEFIDVPSIINGYERGRTATGSFGTSMQPSNNLISVLTFGIGGTQTLIDRPTISYVPQTSSEFTRHLVAPLPPVSILNLIESGAPADVVLELTVESINGIRNRGFTGELQEGDPEFQQVIHTIKRAQDSGHTSMRIVPGADKTSPAVVMAIRDNDIAPDLAEELDQMRSLLHLDPDVHEFKIVFGMLPQSKDEIAFRTRNVIRIMNFLALNVEVPECDLAAGKAVDWGTLHCWGEQPLTVHNGCEPPEDCYTAVQYKDHWFWIDSSDFNSKRSMGYLKILLAMVDTKEKESAPVLTIRAN